MPDGVISIKIDKSMTTGGSFALTRVPIGPFSHLVCLSQQELC